MFRNRFFYAAALFAVVNLASCSKDDDNNGPVAVQKTVDFETVALGNGGYTNDFPDGLMLQGLDFYNSYNAAYSSFEGFAVSDNTDTGTPGLANQYSVWAGGGAGGLDQFAVIFAGFTETTHCAFTNGVERKFLSLKVNNSTYVALSMRDGDDFAKKFAAGDWFKLIVTGLGADGEPIGSVEYYLADFRDGRSFICSEWADIDLSGLGKVNRLEFTFASTDNGQYGMNTPAYACIDNIIYETEQM